MINSRPIREIASLERACSAPTQLIEDNWDRIVQNGQFSVQDRMKTRSHDQEEVEKGESLMGRGEDVPMIIVMVLQEETMQTLYRSYKKTLLSGRNEMCMKTS